MQIRYFKKIKTKSFSFFLLIIDYSRAFPLLVLEFLCLCCLQVAVASFSGGVTTCLCEFANSVMREQHNANQLHSAIWTIAC